MCAKPEACSAARAPGQVSRPPSQKDLGCVSVCCVCSALGVVAWTVSSTATVPGDPGAWLQGWAMKGAPWVAAVNQPTNQPRALDSAKALWILTRLGLAEGGLRDGTAAGLPPGECYGRPLNMSVRLDAFPSSQGEGNGNPLQYSCLENPRDRGAW